ncbi:MAG: hypothetical protein ACTSPW_00085 [Promethearchaeota archaeon]
MPSKPNDILSATIYTYWNYKDGLTCPLCFSKLKHEFNNGGRRVETLKGSIWVITNYYSCTNPDCEMHDAFPAVYPSCLRRKRFSLDVWAKVIQHHFKHHLNYSLISELMWDDWEISISRSTVKHICEFFEMAGKQYMNKKVLDDIMKNGRIVLSLDGAQPVKNEPSLWVFSDRLTGHVLLVKNLESAPASKLEAIFREIEELYGVPIVAVISDKQRNIVNAVKNFNPDIPHAFCQYHFLNHIVKPIASKDSHLKKILKKAVLKLSIVYNSNLANSNNLYSIFQPLSNELKCAVSTKGDRFKVFPGVECYDNLKYIFDQLQPLSSMQLPSKVSRTLNSVLNSLERILSENHQLRDELASLIPDFERIRKILGKRTKGSIYIKKQVDKWVYMLKSRLKRRKLEFNPEKIKWKTPTYQLSLEEIWQQWIRLVHSYEKGLYVAYDNDNLDFTNNPKEQLFHRTKHHFKSLLGRQNVSRIFLEHGGLYSQLLDIDYSKKAITRILLACEIPLIESTRRNFVAQYAVVKKNWKIREIDTGNMAKLIDNLSQLEGV